MASVSSRGSSRKLDKSSTFFCFLSNFRTITRLETLATQASFAAKNVAKQVALFCCPFSSYLYAKPCRGKVFRFPSPILLWKSKATTDKTTFQLLERTYPFSQYLIDFLITQVPVPRWIKICWQESLLLYNNSIKRSAPNSDNNIYRYIILVVTKFFKRTIYDIPYNFLKVNMCGFPTRYQSESPTLILIHLASSLLEGVGEGRVNRPTDRGILKISK